MIPALIIAAVGLLIFGLGHREGRKRGIAEGRLLEQDERKERIASRSLSTLNRPDSKWKPTIVGDDGRA